MSLGVYNKKCMSGTITLAQHHAFVGIITHAAGKAWVNAESLLVTDVIVGVLAREDSVYYIVNGAAVDTISLTGVAAWYREYLAIVRKMTLARINEAECVDRAVTVMVQFDFGQAANEHDAAIDFLSSGTEYTINWPLDYAEVSASDWRPADTTVYLHAADSAPFWMGIVNSAGEIDPAAAAASGVVEEPEQIARFDGTYWMSMGGGVTGTVNCIAADSIGNVYVCGSLTLAGATAVSNIAMWNGAAWSDVGGGTDSIINCIKIDSSDNVYIGGNFDLAGSTTVNRIAKWDGSTWSALGDGFNSDVFGIALFGTDVYAGGAFTQDSTLSTSYAHVAKWNGSAWSAMGAGFVDEVGAMDADSTGIVYAGTGSSAAATLMKWTGAAWATVGAGAEVDGITSCDFVVVDGSDNLYAGNKAMGVIKKWNGATWSADLGLVCADGNAAGTDLYIGWSKYDGAAESTIGTPPTAAAALATHGVSSTEIYTAWASVGGGGGDG